MARLIDADWLLNAIEKLKVRNTSNTATIFDVLGVLDDVEKIIKAAPINDPVKHGHWKDFKYDCQCSVCGMQFDYNDYCTEVFNYCPNCGTKMDEKPGGDKVDEKKEQKE